ncbi:MAG: type III-B CRISPR module-associated Cmr3 family protein [Pseudomonadota bacterium]|jgi:CRISPR-associated protein Cmr3
MTRTLTFDPIDLLMPRGNRLFGGGVHGESLMPPWPSVFAGALASRSLADAGRVDDITRGPDRAEAILAETLGADYALTALALARGDEALFPLPADLVALEGPDLVPLSPRTLGEGVAGVVAASSDLPALPVLATPSRRKPMSGQWITAAGLAEHLAGREPDSSCLVASGCLWETAPRLGIALDAGSRTAAESQIYTTDAVALRPGVRFVADFSGKGLPQDGLVRLGGDGRGARIEPAGPGLAHVLAGLGCPQSGWKGYRMILATPGLFSGGWLPPGVDPVTRRFEIEGLTAELVAASVPRHEVISGWDLANHAPKPARKAAPMGSCYWFRVTGGDTAALASLREAGLWPLMEDNPENAARRREGYNRVWFGAWQPEEI